MVSGEPFPDRSRAHVVLTCRNGVSPNLLPVTAASDRPWTTLSTHVPINKNLKVDWIYSDDDDGFACVYVFLYSSIHLSGYTMIFCVSLKLPRCHSNNIRSSGRLSSGNPDNPGTTRRFVTTFVYVRCTIKGLAASVRQCPHAKGLLTCRISKSGDKGILWNQTFMY